MKTSVAILAAAAIAAIPFISLARSENYKPIDLDDYWLGVTDANARGKIEIVLPIEIYDDYAEAFIPGYWGQYSARNPSLIKFTYDTLSPNQVNDLREACPTPPITCLAHWDITLLRHEDIKGYPGRVEVVSLDGWKR
jgi:hypothetical protein